MANRKRFSFDYRLVKPDENKDEEYCFEEIYARHHYQLHAVKMEQKAKYEAEINQLKKQLASCQQVASSSKYHGEHTTINDNLTCVTKYNFTCVGDDDDDDGDDGDDVDEKNARNRTEDHDESKMSKINKYVDAPTLANVKRADNTTFFPSSPTRCVTARTVGARDMFRHMFNQDEPSSNASPTTMNESPATNTTQSICHAQPPTTTTTTTDDIAKESFSIFVDKTNAVSQLDLNDTDKLPLAVPQNQPKSGKYNEDGSLFVYDPTVEKLNLNRKPLADRQDVLVLAEAAVSIMAPPSYPIKKKIYDDDETTSSLTSSDNKLNAFEFEPPVASTCNLKSILTRFSNGQRGMGAGYKCNSNSVKENLEKETDSASTSGLVVDEDKEKEKLLNDHLGKFQATRHGEHEIGPTASASGANYEKTMSNILAEDFMTSSTKWSNCALADRKAVRSTDDKPATCRDIPQPPKKQVRYADNNNATLTTVLSQTVNVTQSQKTSTHIGSMSVFCWDYGHIEIGETAAAAGLDTTTTAAAAAASASPHKAHMTLDDEKFPTMNGDDDDVENLIEAFQANEPQQQQQPPSVTMAYVDDQATAMGVGKLTSEQLEKTFNSDYYKLYQYSIMDCTQSMYQRLETSASNTASQGECDDMAKAAAAASVAIGADEMSMQVLDMSRLADEQINGLNLLEDETDNKCVVVGGDVSAVVTVAASTQPVPTFTINDDDDDDVGNSNAKPKPAVDAEDSNSNGSSSIEISTTTTSHTGYLNETIVSAVRDPFSYEVKNRLLDRTAIDSLKNNPNYVFLRISAPKINTKSCFTLINKQSYKVLEEIGKGAYAKIYLIESQDKSNKYALKVDRQATAWEFYITETIHSRLLGLMSANAMQINVNESFVRMNQFVKYNNGCFSAMNYYSKGSLLDLINYHVNSDESFPMWFVLYLTLEMLNIVDYLHKCHIIHADMKPDNWLINQLPASLDYFDPSRTKCLVLIDFNRSIDLSMLPHEAEFEAKTDNKSLLCCEMRSNKTWKYQIDYYGVLSSIHCIIHRKYMTTYNVGGRFRTNGSMPRTYDSAFAEFFDTYLNIPSCKEIPSLQRDWISRFVVLFKNELGSSFIKSKKYLHDLNEYFRVDRRRSSTSKKDDNL